MGGGGAHAVWAESTRARTRTHARTHARAPASAHINMLPPDAHRSCQRRSYGEAPLSMAAFMPTSIAAAGDSG
jgi:hypothetical protein